MIAQKLKYYRAVQCLTQKELADCCGWTPGVIGRIESRGSDVTLSVALKIAKALDTKVEDLVGDLTEDQRHELYLANQRRKALSDKRQREKRSRRDKRRKELQKR